MTLGDYTVVKELGEGILGKLLLGEHRFLKKPFSLRVLTPAWVDQPGFLSRFEEEVGHLCKLGHPNLLKIHNVSFSDGSYFLVTDFSGEETLEKRGGTLTEDEVFTLASQLASVIDYLHEVGEPHLRIHLGQVHLSKKGDHLFATLSDVGMHRVATAEHMLTEMLLRVSKTVAVDPLQLSDLSRSFLHAYLSLAPEQRAGNSGTAKSDVYSFGVILYYALTGKMPDGVFEPIAQLHPGHELAWDTVIFACLQQDPAKRPAYLQEILKELSSPIEMTSTPKPVLQPGELIKPEFDADPGAIFQMESVVVKYQPKTSDPIMPKSLPTQMVIVPGGHCLRGSNAGSRDEIPRHEICLSSFAIDIHPVTNEQFVRFLEALGGEKDHNNCDIIRLRESRIKRSGGRLNIESGYSKHPVVGVTWYGAVAYAKWEGKRLPTEAEWEIAAAGGLENASYPTGNTIERSQANFFSSDTTAVMSYAANGYGLYDMAGNVYEWCQDWYDYHYYDLSVQEPQDPKGPHQGVYRVLRGGCWKSLKDDMRCAHRHRNNPGTMNGTYGFRCAADVN